MQDFLSGSNTITPRTDQSGKSDGNLVDLHDVVKTYRSSAGTFTALKGVDLRVESGAFVSIIGKSGSGKSTLINVITGIDRPTSGKVVVDGTAVHNLNEEQIAIWRGRSAGAVFQFSKQKNTPFLPLLSADKLLLGEYLKQKDTSRLSFQKIPYLKQLVLHFEDSCPYMDKIGKCHVGI